MSTITEAILVRDVADVQAAVTEASKSPASKGAASNSTLRVRGGGSKPALSATPADATLLDIRQLSGVLEYQPSEFTFTARAGTPLVEIQSLLAQNGQYLPFDPPFAPAGATLGGTVAAGLSGPGRYRYGGLRDFLIGVRFVDGQGRLVRGGGKVVKNAAGFDFPKLMVGSLGTLGILVELSFKVFPRPQEYRTLAVSLPSLADALQAMRSLAAGPFDLEALDLRPAPGKPTGFDVLARVGGSPEALDARVQRMVPLVKGAQVRTGEDEDSLWRSLRDFSWLPPDAYLVKVPLAPAKLPHVEEALASIGAARHYSVGGNVAWVGAAGTIVDLDGLLSRLGCAGLVIRGASAERPWIGAGLANPFAARVKTALDPYGRFPAY